MSARGVSPTVRVLVRERSGGVCEKCGKARATEQHHRLGRKMGGTSRPWVNRPGNLLDLCSPCHRGVTNTNGQRAFIESMGWLVCEGEQLPSETPVLLHHGLVLLDDEGGYMPALELGGVS